MSDETDMFVGAAERGDMSTILRGCEAGMVNVKNQYGWTAAMMAAGSCQFDVLKALVDHGADLNIRDNDGYTALMLACGFSPGGHGDDIVRYLLDHGANPSDGNNDGWTAAHWAAANGYSKSLSLVAVDEVLDVRDKWNDTPLYHAISFNKPQCVFVLDAAYVSERVRPLHA